jgi:hypothetical protein
LVAVECLDYYAETECGHTFPETAAELPGGKMLPGIFEVPLGASNPFLGICDDILGAYQGEERGGKKEGRGSQNGYRKVINKSAREAQNLRHLEGEPKKGKAAG